MKRRLIYLTIAALTFAVGLVVAINFHFLRGTDKSDVGAPPVASEKVVRAVPAFQSDLLNIVRAPDEPLNIVDIRLGNSKSGDLIIEVENISSKPVTFIGYTLAPADDCPKSDHPLAFWVGYGDWSVLPGDGERGVDPPVNPNHKVTLTFSRYGGILKYHRWAKCPAGVKPDLYLNKVAFSDGTGWEGFADGIDHSEWNGRAWFPHKGK